MSDGPSRSFVRAATWSGLAYAVALAASANWDPGIEAWFFGILFLLWMIGPVAAAAVLVKASRTRGGQVAFLMLEGAIIASTAWVWVDAHLTRFDAWTAIGFAATFILLVPLCQYGAVAAFFLLSYLFGWRAHDNWLKD